MNYLIALLLVVVGVPSVWAIVGYARFRLRAAREYKTYSDDFFDAAKKLVSEDEAPQELLDIIYFMNDAVSDKGIALRLCSYPMHLKWSNEVAGYNKAKVEFLERRPELTPIYDDMICGWFLAVTSLSPISGTAARYSITKNSVGPAVASVSKHSHDHHNQNGNGNSSGQAIQAH